MANDRARELRQSMTTQEVKLWLRLRQLKAQGYHFRRQAPQGWYVLDFVCLRQRLIVEVDGAQHGFDDHRPHDERRDRYFAERGFRTLRFWNSDIDSNLDSVVDTIWHALENARPAERERAP
jgi:very-short-patch-repair endonuclease